MKPIMRLRELAAGFSLFFYVATLAAAGIPDYAREKKWADEVVPGIVVGDPVYLQIPRGHEPFLALFTPAPGARHAVIVVHGMGIHPDWGMIGTLRTALSDRGFSTLSIQMPVMAADAKSEAYPPTFPEAAARIGEAVGFLKAKGYTQLALVSHSMGSRMSAAYMAQKPDASVKSWASLGLSSGDYAAIKRPVLDVYGENDLPQVLQTAAQRSNSLPAGASAQKRIPRADHFYTGQETALLDTVAGFLDETLK